MTNGADAHTMGIRRVLWHPDLWLFSAAYDVLIPLPANHDVCMNAVGIKDFGDADDDWDNDFDRILQRLVNGEDFTLEAKSYPSLSFPNEHRVFGNTQTSTQVLDGYHLTDIQGFLAHDDNSEFIVKMRNKSITFTHGHEIFWMCGFSEARIRSIGFPLELINNRDLYTLF
jgi:hypothetical protein